MPSPSRQNPILRVRPKTPSSVANQRNPSPPQSPTLRQKPIPPTATVPPASSQNASRDIPAPARTALSHLRDAETPASRQRLSRICHARNIANRTAKAKWGDKRAWCEISICPRAAAARLYSGNTMRHQLDLLRLQVRLILFGEIFALSRQPAHHRILREHSSSIHASCDSNCKSRQSRALNVASACAPPAIRDHSIQLHKSRPSRHQALVIHLKRAMQDFPLLRSSASPPVETPSRTKAP